MVSHQLCRDWDANALTLGDTPKLDAEGRVVPIGHSETPSLPPSKTKFYVVHVGRAVGIFYNWGLVSTLVCSFSGNSFKGVVGLENARVAWAEGPAGRTLPWVPPRPGPARPTPHLPPLPRPAEDDDFEDDDDLDFTVVNTPIRAPPIHVPIRPEDYRELRNEARAVGVRGDFLLSPTPSLTSLPSSVSTPSWMSSSTLSPRTVSEPDLTPSFSSLLLGERYTAVDNVISREDAGNGGGVRTRPLGSPTPRAYTLTPTPVNADPNAAIPATRMLLDNEQAARRRKGDPVFVVIRGEHPGVYFDMHTTLLAARYNPAMKIVPLNSFKKACFYFVQKYMAGKVGVPVFVLPVDEAEGTY